MSFRNPYQDKTRDEEKLATLATKLKGSAEILQLQGSNEEKRLRLNDAAELYLEMRKQSYSNPSSLDKAEKLLEEFEKTLIAHGYVLPNEVQLGKEYGLHCLDNNGWRLV